MVFPPLDVATGTEVIGALCPKKSLTHRVGYAARATISEVADGRSSEAEAGTKLSERRFRR